VGSQPTKIRIARHLLYVRRAQALRAPYRYHLAAVTNLREDDIFAKQQRTNGLANGAKVMKYTIGRQWLRFAKPSHNA